MCCTPATVRIPVIAKEWIPSGTPSTAAPSTPLLLHGTVPESVPPEPSDFGSKKICTWSTLAAAQLWPVVWPLLKKAQVKFALAVVGAAGCRLGVAGVSWPAATVSKRPFSANLTVPETFPTRSKLCWPGESGDTWTPSTPFCEQGRSALLLASVSTWLSTLALTTVTPEAAQFWPLKLQRKVTLPGAAGLGAASTAAVVPPRPTWTWPVLWQR